MREWNATPATLYLHVTTDDLRAAAAGEPNLGGSVERLGAATLQLLADWLRRTDRVTIRPVLDPTRLSPVDRHDPPEVMREAVLLRDGHCVFPGCTVDARSCDLDHIDPYVPPDDGGPPGQTSLHNLACLCRRHHRLKTFTAWTYQRAPDDSYAVGQPPRHHLHRQPRPGTLNAADPATRPTREPRAASREPGQRAVGQEAPAAPGPKPASTARASCPTEPPQAPP